MKYFFLKLVPPRLDFMQTMSSDERAVMVEHQGYWAGFLAKGWAVAYGPVADPAGGYGAGFWALPDDQDPAALAAADPAIKSGRGFRYEISPMPAIRIGTPAQG
ncbi:MAG TPA: hypothetical protein VHD15_11570 [Hyphomicrobiales bacterium]|nr:hypothetical protein [Hyphomicrobiales bacterium]